MIQSERIGIRILILRLSLSSLQVAYLAGFSALGVVVDLR